MKWVFIFCILLSQIPFAEEVKFKSLEAKKAKKEYEKDLINIEKQYLDLKIEKRKKYSKSLKNTLKKVMKKGDINEANLLDEEIKKLDQEIKELETGKKLTSSTISSRSPMPGWILIFKSKDPSIWNTNKKTSKDFATELSSISKNAKYVCIRRADTKAYVITDIKTELIDKTSKAYNVGWNGSSKKYDGGHHLGVYSKSLPKTGETKYARGGWGFGHYYGRNDAQAYIWKGIPIKQPTEFQIYYKTKSLTATEKKYYFPSN